MKIEEGKYSVSEIVDWFRSRVLVVNSDYQRGGGLWPQAAKSYFIDTVLRGFPFPKVYFHEKLDRATKRPRREIVDGQQRVTTLVQFVDGEFALGSNAREYAGARFDDLPEDIQDQFWGYTISVDVIRNADRSEILQMFRRMNAYTLPLNESEKRHSEFFGSFKDWVNSILDREGRILSDWNVLSSRQIVRMQDAEFISDIALSVDEGIVSSSPAKLRALYKKNDDVFADVEAFDEKVAGAMRFVSQELSPVQGTFATKTHIFNSLICALIFNKYGLPGASKLLGLQPIGDFVLSRDEAVASILRLASAHEEKDTGDFADYVRAASEGGNRAAQRVVRIHWLSEALRGKFA